MKRDNIFRIIILAIFITGISLLHYSTPLSLPMLHDIFQRLYYIPIILAAFWFGFRGGVGCAIVISIVYAPHVLFQWGGKLTMELEKYLEIVLYNVVGGITGFLSEKEQMRSRQLQLTAKGLEKSYEELRLQAEQIIEIEGQLRKAERLSTIGELASVLAHEIRNPLGSIQGTAEILKDDFQPGDKKYEFLEILVKESQRLNRVVEDFLRLARPQPVMRGDCDLVEELNTIIALVSIEAKKHDVSLEFEPVTLPAVEGDAEKLRQAFLNIILNGLQATPAGGYFSITASVEGPKDAGQSWIELHFSDSGPGIPPEMMSKIFEPFFTTKDGGTGLGLAIARKIVEGHGGFIILESDAGRGTTFIIRLPVKTEVPEDNVETENSRNR
jgi:two-component system sensor histidine kinase HydH